MSENVKNTGTETGTAAAAAPETAKGARGPEFGPVETVRTVRQRIGAEPRSVLDGIDWTETPAEPTPAGYPGMRVLIGSVGVYQLFVSFVPPQDDRDLNCVLQMEQAEINRVYDHAASAENGCAQNVHMAKVRHLTLVQPTAYHAADGDEAKLLAVELVQEWNRRRLSGITAWHARISSVFDNMDAVYSDKAKKRLAAEKIESLGIPRAAVTALNKADVYLIGQLAEMSAKDIKAVRGVSSKGLSDIRFALDRVGIVLPGDSGDGK